MVKKVRTRDARMREKGSEYFTGRSKETKEFEKSLDAVVRSKDTDLQKVKINFNIYGEGGMEKLGYCGNTSANVEIEGFNHYT